MNKLGHGIAIAGIWIGVGIVAIAAGTTAVDSIAFGAMIATIFISFAM